MNRCRRLLLLSMMASLVHRGVAFTPLLVASATRGTSVVRRAADPSESAALAVSDAPQVIDSIEVASSVLRDWDRVYSSQFAAGADGSATRDSGTTDPTEPSSTSRRTALDRAVRLLTEASAAQRNQDPAKGRLMLGICASSAAQGVATLKSWVTALQLPRGLLHGMDEAGKPLEIAGGVFIKYNTGGVYTFAEIRKSGIGFDALWKPGDAMLENYDGLYRGVYYQVELEDGEFRQYLLPLDLFDEIPNN